MTKTIYFLRHGECIANSKGTVAGGEDDSLLTDLGVQQAKNGAKKLEGIKFDLVLSSPMKRALQTADIIKKELGLSSDTIIEYRFTERHVGEFAGRPLEEYYDFINKGGKAGESSEEMRDRVQAGLDRLKVLDFENALVVTHNGTIRMLRIIFEGLDVNSFFELPKLGNGEFYKVEI